MQVSQTTCLIRRVARIGAGVDCTAPYDTKDNDWVVDAVECVYHHSIAGLNSSMLEPSDQLSNQDLRFQCRDRIGSIVGIDIDLQQSVGKLDHKQLLE